MILKFIFLSFLGRRNLAEISKSKSSLKHFELSHRLVLAAAGKGCLLNRDQDHFHHQLDLLHKNHHQYHRHCHTVDHLPRAEDEDACSEESQDARDEDEGVPVVKVRSLHED